MPLYRYKFVDASGDIQEGQMEAQSQDVVIRRLQEAGHTPIRADEVGTAGSRRGLRLPRLRRARLSQRDVGIFTEELATLLGAGVPLDRALEILSGITETEAMGQLVVRIQDAVRGGASLSAALESQHGAFSRFYVNMVRAGEAGGALEAVLRRLSEYLERSKQLRESVLSALIYPAILLTVAGLSVVILLTFVVPQFSQLFEDMGKALPLPTRVVVAVGDVFRGYWWALLLGVVGVVLLVRRVLEDPDRQLRWHSRLLRMRLIGELVTRVEVARFSRTLGTLLNNGVSLLSALAIVRETLNNRAMALALDDVAERAKQGEGLAHPLMESEVFPVLAVHMIRVGEETGRLEQMLLQVADTYDREVQSTVKRLLALMEPLLILGLGVVIAAIIMSILVAILSVNQLAFA